MKIYHVVGADFTYTFLTLERFQEEYPNGVADDEIACESEISDEAYNKFSKIIHAEVDDEDFDESLRDA
jgi:hypothetical protein